MRCWPLESFTGEPDHSYGSSRQNLDFAPRAERRQIYENERAMKSSQRAVESPTKHHEEKINRVFFQKLSYVA